MPRPQVGVLTTYEEHVPERVRQMAYELGRELAEEGFIVITGGDGGLMKDVARGVDDAGGIVVGVLSHELARVPEGHPYHNPHLTVRILAEMSYEGRSSIVVASSDVVVVLAGGCGTLVEVAMAYSMGRPIVVLEGSGLLADRLRSMFPDGYLDHRRIVRLRFVGSVEEAVKAVKEILSDGS
ncbi:MAG TPA: TIGR00725 family protein [Candidatus Bathyarchaeota archaeon]|nr:TIGR00725 family protein [Candidatus Bathyarchaeota archaeon]